MVMMRTWLLSIKLEMRISPSSLRTCLMVPRGGRPLKLHALGAVACLSMPMML